MAQTYIFYRYQKFLRSSKLLQKVRGRIFIYSLTIDWLTQKMVKIQWSANCEKSFAKMKTKLTTTPFLTLPEVSYGYVIYCDALRVGLGCVDAAI